MFTTADWVSIITLMRRSKEHSSRKAPRLTASGAQKDGKQRDSRALAKAKQAWFASMRWRREVERELNMTFTQWLVLDVADDLIRETSDAISQNDIASRLELDKMTISTVARNLEKLGWFSRQPAFGRPAIRIVLTEKGEQALAEARSHAETAAHARAWRGVGTPFTKRSTRG